MKASRKDTRRAANIRTAAVLLVIVLVFFFGVMLKYKVFGQ